MIPHGVRKIGSFSFDGCSELAEVKIGESVEFIGEYCFKKCINLETMHLPNKNQEPKINLHFEGILDIFFDGEVEQYMLMSDVARQLTYSTRAAHPARSIFSL